MSRVLIIEDEKKLLVSLKKGLEQEGYDVTGSATGEDGFYAATTQDFDALVLDLMLPGRDGLQVFRDLRSRGFSQPVLILTARDSVDDRVAGLDDGADDYLVKPFAFAELLAYFLRHVNAVVTRDMLARDVWQEPMGVLTNVIDVYVGLLRKKVERPGLRQLSTRSAVSVTS